MVLPILAYGHAQLRTDCAPVQQFNSALGNLISQLWDTLAAADGCGLAASQTGHLLQLFVVDSITTYEAMEEPDRSRLFAGDSGIRCAFINASIVERSAEEWVDEEGCLSMPGFVIPVKRPWQILLRWQDGRGEKQEALFSGITARMIQHELDHTAGVLHIDYLKPLQRRLLQKKLRLISSGKVRTRYPMRFIGRLG